MIKIKYILAQDLLKKLNSVDDINTKVKLSKKIVDSINDTFLKDWVANTFVIPDVVHNHLSDFWKKKKNYHNFRKNRSESEVIKDDELYYHKIAELEEATRRCYMYTDEYRKGLKPSYTTDEFIAASSASIETENLVKARAERALEDFLYLLKESDYETYNKVFKSYIGFLSVTSKIILIIIAIAFAIWVVATLWLSY